MTSAPKFAAIAALLAICLWAAFEAPTVYDPLRTMQQREVCNMVDCGVSQRRAVD